MSENIENTLYERREKYGDFGDHAYLAQELLDICKGENLTIRTSWSKMERYEREALQMIVHKIARIINGDPHYDDNWRDIAGYATLVLKEYGKTSKFEKVDDLEDNIKKAHEEVEIRKQIHNMRFGSKE